MFAWTAAHFAEYSLLGVTSYFWYYAPLVPAAAVAVGLGLEAAASVAGRVRLGGWTRAFSLRFPLALLLLILSGHLNNLYLRTQNPDPRLAAYTAVGRWLAENTPTGATVGMLEVGMIGYYSGRPIVDFAGLLQPEVASQSQAATTYDDAALWALARYHPDYVVLPDGALPRVDQRMAPAGCVPVQRFPASAYGRRLDTTVYHCAW